MRIFRHFNDLPDDAKGCVVAVGNFDGVHRGHQAVIGEAGRIATAIGVPLGVLTFEPHPRTLFDPKGEPFRLTPFRLKARHIEPLGVDELVVLHFDQAFSELSAETFVKQVLVDGLAARHVVSGYDFVFGHGRKGNCELLLHQGKEEGFDFTAVSAVTDDDGEIYSSTRVRNRLRNGDPQTAAQILGRYFEIEGRVEHGERRGQSIGFPTANVRPGEFLCPTLGVYAVRAGIDEGDDTQWHDGVANLGRRPTFDDEVLLLEVHLFDFDGDLYGRHLRVKLIEFLRPEKKFDGLDSLKAQIAEDAARARHILLSAPGSLDPVDDSHR